MQKKINIIKVYYNLRLQIVIANMLEEEDMGKNTLYCTPVQIVHIITFKARYCFLKTLCIYVTNE